MKVEILTPDSSVFAGEASAIKLPGTKGSFEVLEGHAPIISSLTEGTIRITTGGKAQTIEIKSGFVEVINNVVSVLVDLPIKKKNN